MERSSYVVALVVNKKRYRLVWLIEKEELFIGVINAYRRE